MSQLGEKRVFELCAGHPALELVNTLDWRFRDEGPEELLASYNDLLHFAAQSGILDARETRALQRDTPTTKAERVLAQGRELREAAAQAFYSALDDRKPAAAVLAKLEAGFKAAREKQSLIGADSGLRWEWKETVPELPLWRLALQTEELLTSERLDMVRACANPECRWLFLDASRNHSRRWCEMSICGNRMKARRFKQRVNAGA
jgi:predicted RNA-binding Zn ribbon-like protein